MAISNVVDTEDTVFVSSFRSIETAEMIMDGKILTCWKISWKRVSAWAHGNTEEHNSNSREVKDLPEILQEVLNNNKKNENKSERE